MELIDLFGFGAWSGLIFYSLYRQYTIMNKLEIRGLIIMIYLIILFIIIGDSVIRNPDPHFFRPLGFESE